MSNLAAHLKSFVERIEKLEAEKASLAEDIRGIYREVKDNDLDTKAVRAIVNLRKQDAAKRKAFNDVLDEYLNALGML